MLDVAEETPRMQPIHLPQKKNKDDHGLKTINIVDVNLNAKFSKAVHRHNLYNY